MFINNDLSLRSREQALENTENVHTMDLSFCHFVAHRCENKCSKTKRGSITKMRDVRHDASFFAQARHVSAPRELVWTTRQTPQAN